MEQRVEELEREADATAPLPAPIAPLAVYNPDEVWGDIPHTSPPPPRDFSALAPPPGRRVRFGPLRRIAAATVAAIAPAQRALDEQWESANHAGPGCPFCDAMFSCNCWQERAELHRAAERERVRADRAAIAAAIRDGKCYCAQLPDDDDYAELCDICQEEERLRCDACGKLQCSAGCCGDCGSCSRCRGPECSRCHSWDCCCYDDREDDASSCGCGACEEHDWRAEEGWM
jgi:hypothetical protein